MDLARDLLQKTHTVWTSIYQSILPPNHSERKLQLLSATLPTYFTRHKDIFYLVPYNRKYQPLLKDIKYHKHPTGTSAIKAALEQAAKNLCGDYPVVWVSIPPRPERLKKHGFDQLHRITPHTSPDISLNWNKRVPRFGRGTNRHLRQTSRQGALTATYNHTLSPDTHVIILDDVTTTGATLDEAYRVLAELVAPEQLFMVALAKTF